MSDADDGVTITWQGTPAGICALMMGAPTMDGCGNCVTTDTGVIRCRACAITTGGLSAECQLKRRAVGDVCSGKPCPVRTP
jgi:hypothetical protein